MINLFETHNDFCNEHGVFHRCKINGKDYFFTEERIADSKMPKGLYKAEIRSADFTDKWCTIEPSVWVNHCATIISDEPFKFDKHVNFDGVYLYTEINNYTLDWDEEVL